MSNADIDDEDSELKSVMLKSKVGREIMQKCGERAKNEPPFKEQLKANAKATLIASAREQGIDLRIDGKININVLEESETECYLVIPHDGVLVNLAEASQPKS